MSDEVLRIMCPKLTCRRILAVPAEARGRTVRCKGCATVIRVPARAAIIAPEPEAGADAPPPEKGKETPKAA